MVRSSQLALCCPIEHAPAQVAAEGRTAGNALGQSYGLLNTRAANDFQNRTLSSVHRLDVMPVAAIHDANYCLMRNDEEYVIPNRATVEQIEAACNK